MKSAKDIASGMFASSDRLSTRATTLKRLAGGIRARDELVRDLGLSQKEESVLVQACSVLEEMAATCKKAAKLRKAIEEARQQRIKAVREAMKPTFEALSSTADKVALIGATKSYAFDRGHIGDTLNDRFSADYLLGDYFRQALEEVSWDIAGRDAWKDLAPAAAVEQAWSQFQERRPALQDRFAQVVVRVDRILQGQVEAVR